ncbi:MAG: NUDIX hydrolase [Planctomycetota bacterium]|jgi:8-oxo-dGTP pyrophosphatase MutT (NUDIX family)
MNTRLPQLLAGRLAGELPGPTVAERFEPRPPLWRYYAAPPPDARAAAVLVLLYPHSRQWHLPLTLRPEHLPDHGGQISLPGGAVEPGETSRQAALREFHEELGEGGPEIELLGRLSTAYVQASNFLVTPWVGATRRRPELTPNPAEVEQLLEVPLAHLLDPANFGSRRREHGGRPYTAPHFAWQSHRIWGATCAILGELVTVLEGLDVQC